MPNNVWLYNVGKTEVTKVT